MTQIFLKAKHWQIFLLTIGIPMVCQILFFISMISKLGTGSPPSESSMGMMLVYFPVMMVLVCGIFFGWLWSIVMGLQYKIPEELRTKLTRFQIFFFIPMVYLFVITVLISTFMLNIFESSRVPDPVVMFGSFAVIIPFHLFSMFCIFHTLYFAAKTIKTIELQRKVIFSDFVGEFFLLWFYYIGVWMIQPKVNKMIEE